MCGIVGIIDLAGRGVARADLERMCDKLTHRGPDAEGYFVNHEAGLGQRRLSIIDLSSGKQPMANENGTIWVTFNGEIYNFQELRTNLEALGHRFATHSDTEVIVHAYEQFGCACVKHFRGMFAFGLWDATNRSLFLARDRVGKKPLFYTIAGNQFLFASELQALVCHPNVSRTPSVRAIDEYLTYGYIPAPRTAYQAILKLPPAHYLTLRLGDFSGNVQDLRTERYWELKYTPKQILSENEAVEALLDVLKEAVRLRLIADVPLGALLSGGVDSSIIVALMSGLTSQPVKTFSIGFEEKEFDELPHARAVAQRYGSDHHELIVRPNALEILPTLVRHYGEPYADSSAIPSYYVAKLTRQHVTVALNGDGGDESFAGYERYLGSLIADRLRKLPAPLLGGMRLATLVIPRSLSRRNRFQQAKRLLQASSLSPGRRYLSWVSYLSPALKQSLYTPDFRRQLDGHNAEAWLMDEFETLRKQHNSLDALLALDVRTYLPYDLLVKMDIATMACSLEARSPFLDHKVMEFAATLPSPFKLRRTTLKYLLKKTGAALLPSKTMHRRKMGFGVPVGTWMRNELRPLLEETLLSSSARIRSYFEMPSVRKMVDEHVQGKRDYAIPLWAMLWLELWHREFLS